MGTTKGLKIVRQANLGLRSIQARKCQQYNLLKAMPKENTECRGRPPSQPQKSVVYIPTHGGAGSRSPLHS